MGQRGYRGAVYRISPVRRRPLVLDAWNLRYLDLVLVQYMISLGGGLMEVAFSSWGMVSWQ